MTSDSTLDKSLLNESIVYQITETRNSWSMFIYLFASTSTSPYNGVAHLSFLLSNSLLMLFLNKGEGWLVGQLRLWLRDTWVILKGPLTICGWVEDEQHVVVWCCDIGEQTGDLLETEGGPHSYSETPSPHQVIHFKGFVYQMLSVTQGHCNKGIKILYFEHGPFMTHCIFFISTGSCV